MKAVMEMEVIVPSSVQISASTSFSSSSSAISTASTSSTSGRSLTLSRTSSRRWTLGTTYLSPKEVINVSFYSGKDEKTVYTIAIKARGGRRFGRQKRWESLSINRNYGTGRLIRDDTYRAYRLTIPAEKPVNSCRRAKRKEAIVIFPKSDPSTFLSLIPDETPLGHLSLPGTHESCALYGFPISQCQQPSTPIERQLLDGVRFLDVRLRVVGDELLMYHGPRSQRSSLTALLTVLHNFLQSYPSETLILCLKEESPPFHPHFSALVYQAFEPYLDRWFLEERIPTLVEVRGKGILLTRFDKNDLDESWQKGMGIHPSTWPDSRKEGFEWDCHGTTVRTQDWYRVKTFLSIPEKVQVIINHLEPTLSHKEEAFTLSYTSASYFPLSLPTIIAKGFGWPRWGMGVEGVNSRFFHWLLCRLVEGRKVRACVLSDYYRQCAGDEGLAELLIQMNFVDP